MTTKRHCGLDPQSPDNMEMLFRIKCGMTVQHDESRHVISRLLLNEVEANEAIQNVLYVINFSCLKWRSLCGVVMQDGKMFSDTIINNIVLDDEHIDYERVSEAVRTAQIENEINEMPKGFDTMIGEKGRGLSGGQKQRLLIARSLYRIPRFLFFRRSYKLA